MKLRHYEGVSRGIQSVPFLSPFLEEKKSARLLLRSFLESRSNSSPSPPLLLPGEMTNARICPWICLSSRCLLKAAPVATTLAGFSLNETTNCCGPYACVDEFSDSLPSKPSYFLPGKPRFPSSLLTTVFFFGQSLLRWKKGCP